MPQMSPVLWVVFPFVIVVLVVMVMVVGEKEDVDVGSELLGELDLYGLMW